MFGWTCLRSFFVLLSFSFLVACGSSGGGSGSPSATGKEGRDPANGTGASAGDLATLPMTSWCKQMVVEGQDRIVHFRFQEPKSVHLSFFNLQADGTRGSLAGEASGEWIIEESNHLTMTFGSEAMRYQIFVLTSAESATGAPQLRLWEKPEEVLEFDPCE